MGINITDNGTPDADVGSDNPDFENQDKFEEGDLQGDGSIVQV